MLSLFITTVRRATPYSTTEVVLFKMQKESYNSGVSSKGFTFAEVISKYLADMVRCLLSDWSLGELFVL